MLESEGTQSILSGDPAMLQRVEEKLGLRNPLRTDADLVSAVEGRLALRAISLLMEYGIQEKEIYSLIVPRRTLQHRRARARKS